MALTVKRFPVRVRRIKKWQRATRLIFDSFAAEVLVISLVVLYAIIIFADLAYTAAREETTVSNSSSVEVVEDSAAARWDEAMKNVDIVLLSVFMLEIMLRLFGFGIEYLKDCINAVDAVVVLFSWIIVLLPTSLSAGVSWFRLFRVVRLFRFAVILNKLQRSRDAAAMMRKRNMYRKIGAPVEKVLDFFEDLRSRMPEKKDQEYISWMMEVIASDDLYRVRNFDAETMRKLGGEGDDMSAYIAQVTGISTPSAGAGGEAKRAGTPDSTAEAGKQSSPPKDRTDSRGMVSAHFRQSGLALSVPKFAQGGLWADAMLCDEQLAGMLHTLHGEDAWSFDIFAFDRLCKQKALSLIHI